MKIDVAQRSPKTRRPGSKGYPCGDETRDALIESALQLFGLHGYEGASTREIVAGAGTTTPTLQYYFQNKEGLYLACMERVGELFWATMKEPIEAAERALASRSPHSELIDAFIEVESRLMGLMFSSKLTASAHLIISQQEAGLGPSGGFEQFYNAVLRPLNKVNCAIIGRLAGRPPTHPETVARYIALHGQSAAFMSAPRSTLRALKWESYDSKHVAMLIEIVAGFLRNCLTTIAKPR